MKSLSKLGRYTYGYGNGMGSLLGPSFVGPSLGGHQESGKSSMIYWSHYHSHRRSKSVRRVRSVFKSKSPEEAPLVKSGLTIKDFEGTVTDIYDCYDRYAGIEVRMSPIMYDRFIDCVAAAYGTNKRMTNTEEMKHIDAFYKVLKDEAEFFRLRKPITSKQKAQKGAIKVAKFVFSEAIGFVSPPVVGTLASTAILAGIHKISKEKEAKQVSQRAKQGIEAMKRSDKYPTFNTFLLRDYFPADDNVTGIAPSLLLEDYKKSLKIQHSRMDLGESRKRPGTRRHPRISTRKSKGRSVAFTVPRDDSVTTTVKEDRRDKKDRKRDSRRGSKSRKGTPTPTTTDTYDEL